MHRLVGGMLLNFCGVLLLFFFCWNLSNSISVNFIWGQVEGVKNLKPKTNGKCTSELLSTTTIHKNANYSTSSITKTVLMSLLKSNQWKAMGRSSICQRHNFPEKYHLRNYKATTPSRASFPNQGMKKESVEWRFNK